MTPDVQRRSRTFANRKIYTAVHVPHRHAARFTHTRRAATRLRVIQPHTPTSSCHVNVLNLHLKFGRAGDPEVSVSVSDRRSVWAWRGNLRLSGTRQGSRGSSYPEGNRRTTGLGYSEAPGLPPRRGPDDVRGERERPEGSPSG